VVPGVFGVLSTLLAAFVLEDLAPELTQHARLFTRIPDLPVRLVWGGRISGELE